MGTVVSLEAFRNGQGVVEFIPDATVAPQKTLSVPEVTDGVANASEQILAMTARLNQMNRTIITLRKPFLDAAEVVQFKNMLHRKGFIDATIADADGKEFIRPDDLVGIKVISVAHDVADLIVKNLIAAYDATVEAWEDGITLVKYMPSDEGQTNQTAIH